MNFCDKHGMFENNETSRYWVEKGMIMGYMTMCEEAVNEYIQGGWKVS